jgi:hypothetical protein
MNNWDVIIEISSHEEDELDPIDIINTPWRYNGIIKTRSDDDLLEEDIQLLIESGHDREENDDILPFFHYPNQTRHSHYNQSEYELIIEWSERSHINWWIFLF